MDIWGVVVLIGAIGIVGGTVWFNLIYKKHKNRKRGASCSGGSCSGACGGCSKEQHPSK